MESEEPENILVPGQGLRRVHHLKQKTAIGFSGNVKNGLLVDPNGTRVFYPLGASVVVKSIRGNCRPQSFLTGHTYLIGCIDISKSGKYLATGETHQVGSKVQVIVWDLKSLTSVGSHLLHHANVAAVGISPNDLYVASAGGQDDPSVLVWDIQAKTPICVGKKTYDRPFVASCLTFALNRDTVFMVGGLDAVHVWKLQEETNKVANNVIPLGKIKRNISNMLVCEGSDRHGYYVFCATDSGDIVKLHMDGNTDHMAIVACAVKRTPKKGAMNAGKFAGGVTSLISIRCDELLVASGDGNVCLVLDKSSKMTFKGKSSSDGIPTQVQEPTKACLQEIRGKQFPARVTSLAKLDQRVVLVGCDNGDIYEMDVLTFDISLLSTCHTGPIADIAFPKNLDTVFGTCGQDGLRVWSVLEEGGRQVLHVPGPVHAKTLCLLFSNDGQSIVTGWSDGCIRAYTPESGKAIYVVQGVHISGVSSMALLSKGLITGGVDGQMRTWHQDQYRCNVKPKLLTTVREHKGQIVAVQVSSDELECISASKDGACIIWDIQNFECIMRRQILNATSSLVWAQYHPSQCQILTLATDGQVSYWEAVDGQEIRHLILGKHSSVTALDIAPVDQGNHFLTATDCSLVKVWKYKQGGLLAQGKARSGPISRAKYSPGGKYVVAVTQHGAILLWENYSERP